MPEKDLLSKQDPPLEPGSKPPLEGVSLRDKIQATLVRQIIIVGLIAAVYFVWQGDDHARAAVSAVYGGLTACMMSLLLALEVTWLNRRLRHKQRLYHVFMFLSFAPRLVIVIAAFWLGVSILNVMPAPMIIAFSASYIAFLLDFRGPRKPASRKISGSSH